MPNTVLPFEHNRTESHEHEGQDGLRQCGLYQILPKEGKEIVEESTHVLEYLHMLPLDSIGTPNFYSKLSRNLKGIKHPNLVYPLNEEVAVHICPDKGDARNYYIPIEPTLFKNLNVLIEDVEKKIAVLVDRYDTPKDREQKKSILEKCIDEVCEIKTDTNGGNKNKGNQNLQNIIGKFMLKFRNGSGNGNDNDNDGKLSVTPFELKGIKYLMVRDKVGLGVLEPLIQDPYIEDISCSGLGNIFIEHKIFDSLKSPIEFESAEDLDLFVVKLSEKIGKPISFRTPIMDAVLPDGSRINIVFGEDISKKGSNFTIRKFSETPLSVLELIEFNTFDYLMAAYFWICLRDGMNMFISGETASGKTTTMNALTTFIPPNSKIVSIEDTAELQVPHKNWTREITRSGKEEGGSGVGMFDLLKAALRQRPNEIIVGEIRGVEGNIVFQGMQTGHPAMSTFHAASVIKLIQRLTGDPINVPRTYVDNLNVVIIQQAVRGKDGKMLRRVTSVSEIVGYDASTESFSFIEVFKWNPVTDTFDFPGNMNSYLLEEKIAAKKGIPQNKKRQIYKELENKANMLKKINKSGVTNFYDFFSLLSKMETEGVV
ncbi:MAG: type II/IV secretion system ATPase subunit [Methanomicrobia archaeon]|nr:type II/IV secretion system ATPase subunit [Methanomicrobia archaeon]